MQTKIHPALAGQPEIEEANEILRSCVHCGFCTATCPTYRLLGDELDGPRGRIYLIKQLLETNTISAASQQHLDRCLTCRACETTCPSGVRYGQLLDTGRELANQRAGRKLSARALRWLLRKLVPNRRLFAPLLRLGQLLRWALPATLKRQVPPRVSCPPMEDPDKPDLLLLGGCVQTPATPQVNLALQRLLSRLGIKAKLLDLGCCGSLDYHLAAKEAAMGTMREVMAAASRYPDLPLISSASGCGLTLKEYGHVFRHQPEAAQAQAFSSRVMDAVELLEQHEFSCRPRRVSVHIPCTMQHGLGLLGRVEALLAKAGFTLLPVQDGHLCCGSAGTYSLLQPELATQLRDNKLAALSEQQPEVIVTANIGCQLHLAAGAAVPVQHWLELLADQLIDCAY